MFVASSRRLRRPCTRRHIPGSFNTAVRTPNLENLQQFSKIKYQISSRFVNPKMRYYVFTEYGSGRTNIHSSTVAKHRPTLSCRTESLSGPITFSFWCNNFPCLLQNLLRQLTAFRSSADRSGSRNKAVVQGYVTTVVGV
jgi:hypothetical protein